MGAGSHSELTLDDSSEAGLKSLANLLKQAMEVDLGFSESQLRNAINKLVKVYGSIEEAYSWIPQDNFTVLVEYILDDTNMESQVEKSGHSSVPSEIKNGMKAVSTVGNYCDKNIVLEKPLGKESSLRTLKMQGVEQNVLSVGNNDSLNLANHKGYILPERTPADVEELDGSGTTQFKTASLNMQRLSKDGRAVPSPSPEKNSKCMIPSKNALPMFCAVPPAKGLCVDEAKGKASSNRDILKDRSHFSGTDSRRSSGFKPELRALKSFKKKSDKAIDKKTEGYAIRLASEERRISCHKSRDDIIDGRMKNNTSSERIRKDKGFLKGYECIDFSSIECNVSSIHSKKEITNTRSLNNMINKNEKTDHQASRKRESNRDYLGNNPNTSNKRDRRLDLEDVPQPSHEARTSRSSGCEDLASGHDLASKVSMLEQQWSCGTSSKHDPNNLLTKNPRTLSSIAENFGTDRSAVVICTNRHINDLHNVDENLSSIKGVLLKEKRLMAGTKAEIIDLSDQQSGHNVPSERTVTVLQGDKTCKGISSIPENDRWPAPVLGSHKVKVSADNNLMPNSSTAEPGRSLLDQLEVNLKAGDCDSALQVLTAWKNDASRVGITKTLEKSFPLEDIPGKKKGFVVSCDISRGLEKLPISCVNEYNSEVLPEDFLYVTSSVIAAAAHVDTSFSRIGDLHCSCSDDCFRSSEPCKCTDSTRGEYGYDENGHLIQRLAMSFDSRYATENGDFITECCAKCRCSMNCGNRIVQRGITKRLQVFMTAAGKGWGVRALEKIPARSFVFEYIGEINTNEEQFYRNMDHEKRRSHTYTMNLDADFDMEQRHFGEGLMDTEALVLDATNYGNVSRFLNHRCNDANLFIRPVQIETRDTHYYHAAFFAVRDIEEMEELTWDYGINFSDDTHQVKAFKCCCGSLLCRDKQKKRNRQAPCL